MSAHQGSLPVTQSLWVPRACLTPRANPQNPRHVLQEGRDLRDPRCSRPPPAPSQASENREGRGALTQQGLRAGHTQPQADISPPGSRPPPPRSRLWAGKRGREAGRRVPAAPKRSRCNRGLPERRRPPRGAHCPASLDAHGVTSQEQPGSRLRLQRRRSIGSRASRRFGARFVLRTSDRRAHDRVTV